MVLEIANIIIKQGQNKDFELSLKQAQGVLIKAKGYINHHFHQCLENEHKYVLLIQWQSLAAHTVGFRESSLFQEWRSLIGEYFQETPIVEHFELKFPSN